MRLVVCKDCGKAYEAESRLAPCPRCAAIDILMPEPPRPDTPAVAIPFAVIPRKPAPRITTDGAEPYRAPPQADEAPPPIVIPGPPSSLSNTLSATVAERPEDLARFAATPPNRIVDKAKDLGLDDPSEKECPRCAERVKARARMCRFCDYDFASRESPSPKKARSSGRLERVREEDTPPRLGRFRLGRRSSGGGAGCACGALMSEVIPTWAIVCAILFFPLGLLFLLVKERRCTRCQPGPSSSFKTSSARSSFCFCSSVTRSILGGSSRSLTGASPLVDEEGRARRPGCAACPTS